MYDIQARGDERHKISLTIRSQHKLGRARIDEAVATSPETFRFDPDRVEEGSTLVGFCRGLVTFEEATKLVRLVRESFS